MKFKTLKALNSAIAERQALVLERNLSRSEDRILFADHNENGAQSADIARAFRTGKSVITSNDAGEELFLRPYLPSIQVHIIGAVHIAQPLVQFAQALDLKVRVIDPRGLYASQERFPDVELVDLWPDEAFEKLGLDESTAVVCLSHDPKLDDPALIAALSAGRLPKYIGALGSRRTHAKRVERLEAAGFSQEQIASIASPIGLNIGAVSPAEIAVAIIAEIVARYRLTDTAIS